jgi:hypothetical protein
MDIKRNYFRVAIKDFIGYEVDSDGNVWGKFGEKLRLGAGRGDGRKSLACLTRNGKKFTRHVYRLMAQAFLPNPEKKPFVCHKNGNSNDNLLSNLYWGTAKENQVDRKIHGTFQSGIKLNGKQVRVIKHILTIPNHISMKTIGKIFGVTAQAIFHISKGNSWKQVQITEQL